MEDLLKDVKGTKSYLPEEEIIREKIRNVLEGIFKRYGFAPVETSILDYYELAESKYGGGAEILKEIYRLKDQGGRNLILRYELTFKLAKLIGSNPNIILPFKRYEIGKVFRDGPVKPGRLREFTQCDVDVVGIKDVVADAELLKLASDVFSTLGLDITILLNDRKLLFGIEEDCKIDKNKLVDVALSLDKLEKQGEKYVKEEIKNKGISEESVNKLFDVLNFLESKNTNTEKINYLRENLKSEIGKEGLEEIDKILKYCEILGVKEVKFSPTLARGLSYYTGPIWEIFAKNNEVTSAVAGGGRWDEMIGKFLENGKEYPATGMAFGLDAIYAALKSKGIKIENEEKIPQILVISINETEEALKIATKLRDSGYSVDIAYFDLSKALDYANKKGIPYAIILGKKEVESKKLTIRDLEEHENIEVEFDDILNWFETKIRK